jgi:hypothetical protein
MSLFQCSICKEKYYSPILVKRHQESEHTGQEGTVATFNYQCPQCKMVMGHPDSVKNHAMNMHGIQMVNPVEVAA